MAELKTMQVKGEDGAEITVGVLGPGGNPIYLVDGKEVEQDFAILRADLTKANGEAAERRVRLREAEERLAAFEGVDPEKAKTALAVVANLDDKKLLDSKQVETMKAQWEESFKKNKESSDATYELKIKELSEQVSAEQAKIEKMVIKGAFLGSKFLDQTIYGPVREDAYKIYGDRFVSEPGDNGDLRPVYRNQDGTPLISVARPGQVASFDEAIEHIITTSPQKDFILRGSQASGSGAQGGAGGGSKSTMQQLMDRHAAAIKANNISLAMSLKDQMSELQREGGA